MGCKFIGRGGGSSFLGIDGAAPFFTKVPCPAVTSTSFWAACTTTLPDRTSRREVTSASTPVLNCVPRAAATADGVWISKRISFPVLRLIFEMARPISIKKFVHQKGSTFFTCRGDFDRCIGSQKDRKIVFKGYLDGSARASSNPVSLGNKIIRLQPFPFFRAFQPYLCLPFHEGDNAVHRHPQQEPSWNDQFLPWRNQIWVFNTVYHCHPAPVFRIFKNFFTNCV